MCCPKWVGRDVIDISSLCCSSDSVDVDQDPRLSWVNVKPYLGVNDHLKGVDWGRHAAKVSVNVVP